MAEFIEIMESGEEGGSSEVQTPGAVVAGSGNTAASAAASVMVSAAAMTGAEGIGAAAVQPMMEGKGGK